MKKTLIALSLLVSAFSYGASPLGDISRTNTIYTAAQTDAKFATIDDLALKADTSALSTTSNALAQAIALKANTSDLSTTSNTLAQAIALKQDASTAATDVELAAVSNTLAQAVAEVDGIVSALPPQTNVRVVSTNEFTLGLADANDIFILTNACTINIPANSVVDWSSVDYSPLFYFRIETTNTIVVDPGAGVTVNDPHGILDRIATNGNTWAMGPRTTNYWDVY